MIINILYIINNDVDAHGAGGRTLKFVDYLTLATYESS